MGQVSLKPVYLIDTVILIDHLRGDVRATRWIGSLKDGEAVLSVVTRAEVLAGADENEEPALLALLDLYPCLPIHPSAADRAAALRKEFKWKLPDAFQAALALEHGLILATRNTRDFPEARHPFVKVPYR
ncbi:MAG: PIN domain-containing protein [Elusimicrobiota bacterium]